MSQQIICPCSIFKKDPTNLDRMWDDVSKFVPNLTKWGCNLLKDGLKNYVGSILVEPRYICKDHRNLYSNFYSKKFQPHIKDCSRLHFFEDDNLSREDVFLNVEKLQKSYIGYSVIRPLERCIGRTIIDPEKIGKGKSQKHYILRTKFRVHLLGREIYVLGYPYISQDAEVNVCAHTVLWNICRYLSERYSNYPETYPYDLVLATSDDTQGRTTPYRGMTYTDYSHILSDFGTHPVLIRFLSSNPSENEELAKKSSKLFSRLYSYVESGFPVIASYGGHVVAIVGHTIDYPERPPSPTPGDIDSIPKIKDVSLDFINSLVDSSIFLKQFIVVDDNKFPYQLLGRPDDKDNYIESQKRSINTLRSAVCPLPEKVYLPSEKARTACYIVLSELYRDHSKEIYGGDEKNIDIHSNPLVVRLFVTTSTALKRKRMEAGMLSGAQKDGIALKIAELHMPHFVWVMEISPYSLYKDGFCTTEIVLDTTSNIKEDVVLYSRIGPIFILNRKEITHSMYPNLFKQFVHNLGG